MGTRHLSKVCMCLGVVGLMGLSHPVALAEDNNPYEVRKRMRKLRQELTEDVPVTLTFGMSVMTGTWRPLSWYPFINAQIEVHLAPKTSAMIGGQTWALFSNMAHLGVRQGFGKNPGQVFFLEGGLAFGRSENLVFFGPGRETVTGLGPRVAVGYKRQFSDRFVLEVGAGLSATLHSKWEREELNSGEDQPVVQVMSRPRFVVPELSVRVGWRFHKTKAVRTGDKDSKSTF